MRLRKQLQLVCVCLPYAVCDPLSGLPVETLPVAGGEMGSVGGNGEWHISRGRRGRLGSMPFATHVTGRIR